jgi:hypothetical protein
MSRFHAMKQLQLPHLVDFVFAHARCACVSGSRFSAPKFLMKVNLKVALRFRVLDQLLGGE